MLDERITINIRGRKLPLRTDNAKQLLAAADALDSKISKYCSNDSDLSMDGEKATILGALECFTEIEELKAKLESVNVEVSRLRAGEQSAKKAVEDSRKLLEENAELKNSVRELDAVNKKNAELIGKNEQLAETLKEANEKTVSFAKLEKELSDTKKTCENLEKENSRLSQALKENEDKAAQLKSECDEKNKKILSIEKNLAKYESVVSDNKRLSEKLNKFENYEESYNREQKRANSLETERNTLKAANEHLSKVDAENKKTIAALNAAVEEAKKQNIALAEKSVNAEVLKKEEAQLSEKIKDCEAEKSALTAELNELKVKFSQIESENIALKQAESTSTASEELEKLKGEFSELSDKNGELIKEIKSLKKTNSSLENQIREMLEDGQLTL